VPEGNANACLCETSDKARWNLFGGERDKKSAVTRRYQHFPIRISWPAEKAAVVNPRSFRRKKRAFQMKAQNCWLRTNGDLNSRDGGSHFLRRIGDQGWQEAGGAEFAVSGRNNGDSFRCWRIVKEYVAAAIDLEVDEARHEPDTVWQDTHPQASRNFAARHDAAYARAVNNNTGILMAFYAIEHLVGHDGVQSA